MTTTFRELYQALQKEADPWKAAYSIQAYVMRALAWAFADRLEATGGFQHTFLPDFVIHLQPGPRLAIHLRFSEVSALSLAQSIIGKNPRQYKHIILVTSVSDSLADDRKIEKDYKRRGVLVTSYELIDQIARVVDIVEECGPYSTSIDLRRLQRSLEHWCLNTYGWKRAPTLDEFVGHEFLPTREVRRLLSTPVTVWVSEDEQGDHVYRYVLDSTSLGIRQTSRKSFDNIGRGDAFHRVRRITDIARPTILLTRSDAGVHVPVLACTFTRHAPMGQNAYQVLPQAVACAEAGTPFILVAPERAPVERMSGEVTVEKAHPLLYQALTQMMHIYRIPILMLPWPYEEDSSGLPILRYDRRYPSLPDRASSAIQLMFRCIDFVLQDQPYSTAAENLLGYHGVSRRRLEMEESRFSLGLRAIQEPPRNSGILLQTSCLKTYIRETTGLRRVRWPLRLRQRPTTLILTTYSRTLRRDPYLGTLLAFDFAFCRTGPRVEHRSCNLFVHFRRVSLEEAVKKFFEDDRLKRIRSHRVAVFLRYADALLFKDGMIARVEDQWVAYRA